jgi:hypothetical protein
MFVYITNKNNFVHEDRFDGQTYVFEPGVAQVVPHDAASHMFGWNKKDKTPTLLRMGWANQGMEGVKKLSKFIIEEAKFEKPKSADEIEQPRIIETEEGPKEVELTNPNRAPVFAGQPRSNRQAPQS